MKAHRMTPEEFSASAAQLRRVPRETRRDVMVSLMFHVLATNGFHDGVFALAEAQGIDVSDLKDTA
jgi:hypothetical protein